MRLKIVDNREIPDICLQHMIAVMLIDKTASFKSAHDVARMKDPAVLRQRAKVRLVGDEDLEKLMPRRSGSSKSRSTMGCASWSASTTCAAPRKSHAPR